MPRNDQVTRQWYLLVELENGRGLTLQEMRERLPEEIQRHDRTLRRDLEALEAAGFPITTDHVNGQTRWKLIEGFRRVPALSFSPTELMSLTFSRNLLKPLEGTEIQRSLSSALNKAAAALPPQGLEYVHEMERVFSVGLGPHKSYREHKDKIDRITEAISQARTAQMRYYSASRNATTRRDVDPYRIWYAAGGLYLIAYCHLRRDVRHTPTSSPWVSTSKPMSRMPSWLCAEGALRWSYFSPRRPPPGSKTRSGTPARS